MAVGIDLIQSFDEPQPWSSQVLEAAQRAFRYTRANILLSKLPYHGLLFLLEAGVKTSKF
jgi:hypothetical protein